VSYNVFSDGRCLSDVIQEAWGAWKVWLYCKGNIAVGIINDVALDEVGIRMNIKKGRMV
jgi:hypothetical protein